MRPSKRTVPYTFLAPYLVLFTAFLVLPLIYAVYVSLFQGRTGVNVFVGLQNYRTAMGDSEFWSGVRRVLIYAVAQVVVTIGSSLGLALLLDSPWVKLKSLFRLLYFLPYAVPAVIGAIMWGFLYSPQLDPLLRDVGGTSLGLLSANHLLYGIVIIVTWELAGYYMTIYYANLTSIPLDLYDAGKIDGCSEWQLAVRIKIPLIRPAIMMTAVLSIIWSLQLFNEPMVLSTMASLPPSFTPNMFVYNMEFTFGNTNYAATLSVILILITLAVTLVFLIFSSRLTPRGIRRTRTQLQARPEAAPVRPSTPTGALSSP